MRPPAAGHSSPIPWQLHPCRPGTGRVPDCRKGRARAPLAWPYQKRRWGSNPLHNRFAGGCLAVWLQRHVIQCPRQESNLVLDLRRVACDPQHSENVFRFSAPPRNRTSSGSFEDCHAIRHTHRAFIQVSRPGLEPGSGPSEGPNAIPCTIETFSNSIPTWSRTSRQGFRGAPCDPQHHRDVSSGPTAGLAPA